MSWFVDRAHAYPGAKAPTLSTKLQKIVRHLRERPPGRDWQRVPDRLQEGIIRARPKFRAGIYKGTKPWLSVLLNRPR
jgi:hypothetical protein